MNSNILYQILYKPIFVPIKSSNDAEPSPVIFDISERDLVLGFSTPLALAMICGEGAEYLEMSAKDIFPNLAESALDFGFNFGQDDAAMYGSDQLLDVLKQADQDQIIDVPKTLEFVEVNPPAGMINALEEVAPHEGVLTLVREKNLGLVICVSQKELDAHIGLLAQLHDVAVRAQNEEQVTLMPYRSQSDLGDDFDEFAYSISPRIYEKTDKPPILR